MNLHICQNMNTGAVIRKEARLLRLSLQTEMAGFQFQTVMTSKEYWVLYWVLILKQLEKFWRKSLPWKSTSNINKVTLLWVESVDSSVWQEELLGSKNFKKSQTMIKLPGMLSSHHWRVFLLDESLRGFQRTSQPSLIWLLSLLSKDVLNLWSQFLWRNLCFL
jgi:hypothetical protein